MKYLVNLNVRSNYSFLSSSIKLKDYLSFAKNNNLTTLSLTDENVMYGAHEFYQLCLNNKIKPIIGLDCQLTNNDQKINLTLLAKNYQGYQTLIKLSTIINTTKPILTKQEINDYLINNDNLFIIIKIADQKKITLEQFFHLLEPKKSEIFFGVDETNVNQLNELIKITKNIVATNLVTHLVAQEAEIVQILTAIKTNTTLTTKDLVKNGKNYYHNEGQLKKIFPEWILENNNYLINNCHLVFPILTNKEKLQQLPNFKIPNNTTSEQYLKLLCKKGLEKRLQSKSVPKTYVTRLLYELSIINTMNFNDYFLIVQDYIQFAKSKKIIVGPGRGSVAGSLVAYVLEITDVDPIKYDLIFERFLNVERTSLPDIDIDFQDERREEVIQYLGQKYGIEHVSHIVTFQTIASKMAIRDLGRVFNISLEEISEISKLILLQYNFDLQQAIKASPKLSVYAKKYPIIFDLAQKIIGFPRQTSTHAAGIILAKTPLSNLVPLQNGFNNIFQTQYSMQDLETIGLIKMDILGLRNLTILNNILEKVSKYYQKELNLNALPLNNQATFAIIANGDTTGIFQLESPGMRAILKDMHANSFEDIVATNALFRPGPQDYVASYIKRKLGKEKVTYLTNDLKPYLAPTFGIILFQEQILLILQKIAGFSLAKADLIRRAIGKKDLTEMTKQETLFINSAINQGYNKIIAEKIWNDIKQFAGYGFNRSHAVSYSLISYWLAYLKANYPLAFMACLLISVVGNQQKLTQYLSECQKYQIKIYPPSINHSTIEFLIDKKNHALVYSLLAVKQMTQVSCQALVTERTNNGLFKDYFNFCARCLFIGFNRKNLEYLIAAGALDEINDNRTMLLKNLDNAVKYANIVQIKDQKQQQIKLNLNFETPRLIEYQNNWMANSVNEYKALGLYLKYNPEIKWKQALDKKNETISLADINNHVNQIIKVVAKINAVKVIKTKNNQLMAFLMVQNNNNIANVTVFNQTYQSYQDKLQVDKVVLMEAKIEVYQGRVKLVLNKILGSL
ncbi:MAG: DNA polymerase III subunit alpha [Spiroplasma sp.]|nr:DNA polymerase III subunit alpha [Spiroplasma sp.]